MACGIKKKNSDSGFTKGWVYLPVGGGVMVDQGREVWELGWRWYSHACDFMDMLLLLHCDYIHWL